MTDFAGRIEVIRTILERYDELTDPMQAGNGSGDTGLRLMPATYTASVREVERLLVQARDDRSHPLVTLETGAKASIRSLWWHLNARYIASHDVIKPRNVTRRAKNGKKLTVAERQVVPQYDPRVRLELVDAGVAWLARSWARQFEPMLPAAVLLEDAA